MKRPPSPRQFGVRRHHPALPGFTLAELLVAITITTLMLLLINQLFQSTSRAVTVGLNTADITMEAEIIGKQIRDDFERMRPPNNSDDGGFLVIVQHAVRFDDIDGVEVMRRGRFAPDLNELPERDPYREPFIRSDQVIFIKGDPADQAPPFRSVTPRNDDQFGSSIEGSNSRIRYGHARRVEPGTETGEPLGQGVNRWANNWVLARHETLLDPHDPVDGQVFDPNLDWHTETVGWRSPMPQPPGLPNTSLADSITDVANQNLGNVLDHIADAETAGDPYYDPLLAPEYEVAVDEQGPYGWTPPDDLPLVNPAPELDDGSHAFDAWRIGQMHPVLSGHVSDFIVEFAGDYVDDDGDPNPDGRIDRDEDGNIIWYAFEPTDPDDAQAFVNYEDGDDFNPYRPRVEAFPHGPSPGGFDHQGNPSTGPDDTMYHLGPDELDDEYGGNFDRTAVFVWRHDDATDDAWPWLVRVRYRLHDPRGHVQSPRLDDAGERDEPWLGQWYEHVIALPRN